MKAHLNRGAHVASCIRVGWHASGRGQDGDAVAREDGGHPVLMFSVRGDEACVCACVCDKVVRRWSHTWPNTIRRTKQNEAGKWYASTAGMSVIVPPETSWLTARRSLSRRETLLQRSNCCSPPKSCWTPGCLWAPHLPHDPGCRELMIPDAVN